jgi:hypothetical protein
MRPQNLTSEMRSQLYATRTRGLGWEHLLRPACGTLVRMAPDAMRSVSVSGRLNGGDDELLLLLGQAKELATEYGLESDVWLDDTAFNVTFTRGGGTAIAKRVAR